LTTASSALIEITPFNTQRPLRFLSSIIPLLLSDRLTLSSDCKQLRFRPCAFRLATASPCGKKSFFSPYSYRPAFYYRQDGPRHRYLTGHFISFWETIIWVDFRSPGLRWHYRHGSFCTLAFFGELDWISRFTKQHSANTFAFNTAMYELWRWPLGDHHRT
jgi:hypothetical protein